MKYSVLKNSQNIIIFVLKTIIFKLFYSIASYKVYIALFGLSQKIKTINYKFQTFISHFFYIGLKLFYNHNIKVYL